jgi:hypothetical protein
MALGNVLGEFTGKVTSVRITDLGGGRRRLEIDSTGEVKGQVPGQVFATMVVEGVPGQAVTYTSTGAILAASGAVVYPNRRGPQGTVSGGRVFRHRRPQAGRLQRPTFSRGVRD